MLRQFDGIMRTYELRGVDYPKKREPWFFSSGITERDNSELLRIIQRTGGQRANITQNILKTLEEALGRKVEVAGIRGEDLPAALSFSYVEDSRIGHHIDFMLTDDKGEGVGSLVYLLPQWICDSDLPPSVLAGKIHLNIPGSAIKDEAQYNALRILLGKVQSA